MKLSLKNSKHNKNLLLTINKMLKHNKMLDVQITIESKTIHVHQTILLASSLYFRNKFGNHTRIKNITIIGVKYSVFKAIIDFMYNGKVSVRNKDYKYFLAAAAFYKIRGLEDLYIKEESIYQDVIIHCPSILTCPFKEIPAIREDECKKSSVSKESEQPRDTLLKEKVPPAIPSTSSNQRNIILEACHIAEIDTDDNMMTDEEEQDGHETSSDDEQIVQLGNFTTNKTWDQSNVWKGAQEEEDYLQSETSCTYESKEEQSKKMKSFNSRPAPFQYGLRIVRNVPTSSGLSGQTSITKYFLKEYIDTQSEEYISESETEEVTVESESEEATVESESEEVTESESEEESVESESEEVIVESESEEVTVERQSEDVILDSEDEDFL